MGGFFILEGKRIFTDFFYNHQPGMAFFSALVQMVSSPQSIPELILAHRQSILIVSFVLNILLIARFGKFFILLAILYELTKFYVFGDRFLAEGIVVYLLIYQTGVVWQSLFYKKENKIDLVLMPIFTWAVFFLREPVVLVTLALFALYLFGLREKKANIIKSSGLFVLISILSFLPISVSDYIYNVFTLNRNHFDQDLTFVALAFDFVKSLFYPFYIIFSPDDWTQFRIFLALLSGIFITLLLVNLIKFRTFKETLFIVGVLMLSNIRPVEASRSFYEAFHIIPWYGLLIFCIIFLLQKVQAKSKRLGQLFALILVISLAQFALNKHFFAFEKVNVSDEYFLHYSHVMGAGTVVRNLSHDDDTLFVDGLDELVQWESKRTSPYQYAWYTSFMPAVEKYSNARDEMFKENSPDFYYGKCMTEHKKDMSKTSQMISKNYTQLKSSSNNTCILIKNDKVGEITDEQKAKLNGYDYSFEDLTE